MVRANVVAVALAACLAPLAYGVQAAEPLTLSVRFAWASADTANIVTDLGFAVRLARGEVTSAGFALVPCNDQKTERGARSFDPAIVRIGHFSGALPNQLPVGRIESLIERNPYTIEGFDPPDIEYCQAHIVMGATRGGLSLRIEGEYRSPGADTWRAFSVATPEAYGAFVTMISPDGRALRGRLGSYRSVIVARPASGWFDGIDFRTASGVAIGHAVLSRVANGTKITLGP